jgi:hypothetical protein
LHRATLSTGEPMDRRHPWHPMHDATKVVQFRGRMGHPMQRRTGTESVAGP